MANLSIFKSLVSKSLINEVKTAEIKIKDFLEDLYNDSYSESGIHDNCVVERSYNGIVICCGKNFLEIDCKFLRFGIEFDEACNFYEWYDAFNFFLSEIEGRVKYIIKTK